MRHQQVAEEAAEVVKVEELDLELTEEPEKEPGLEKVQELVLEVVCRRVTGKQRVLQSEKLGAEAQQVIMPP